jgi:hypothetical protein
VFLIARSGQSASLFTTLFQLLFMEAITLKVAADVAAPVGTYIYEALKKQTGRAKFEEGENSLQSGFAILRDDKAGRLLPARERLELLQTHSEYTNLPSYHNLI